MHGLRTTGTEVDDREPALTERHSTLRIYPDRAGIGSAMPHRFDHGLADRSQCVGRSRRTPIHHPGYATHPMNPAPRRVKHFVAGETASVQAKAGTRLARLAVRRQSTLIGGMKIVFFIRSLEVGGSQRQLAMLADGLARRGHDVIAAVFYTGK